MLAALFILVLATGLAALSFEDVFRAQAPFVYRTLRNLGANTTEAEDLSQEVFVVIHRKLSGFEGRSKLETWIYGICIRTLSDWRRRAVRREQPAADPAATLSAPSLEEELVRRDRLTRLRGALDRLDEDKRNVFVLFELEQLSMKEVAQAVGCPLQTAYARLYAGRRELQAHFQPETKEARDEHRA
jgi:RNA polymerase sigma-70 factor (ECF subfamily)